MLGDHGRVADMRSTAGSHGVPPHALLRSTGGGTLTGHDHDEVEGADPAR